MRIITKGVAPEEVEYEHRCKTCGTLFAFYLNEVKHHDDQREGSSYECKCPHCNRSQYISTLNPVNKAIRSNQQWWDR